MRSPAEVLTPAGLPPGYWAGKVPALPLFAAVPFGPPANEYMAWFYFGGGRHLFEEIYARHNIRGLLCGVIPPEASGWFRRPVESVEDLQGLRMRFFGLGAKVMDRIGVSTQLLAAGDIFPALEMGTIHATEFSMPAIDLNLGFHQVAKHYYFPGWHQQSTNLELIINMESWNGLSPLQQMQVEVVCGDSFRHSIAEGETIQNAAIDELELRGVTIHRWPESMLATFRTRLGADRGRGGRGGCGLRARVAVAQFVPGTVPALARARLSLGPSTWPGRYGVSACCVTAT